MVAKQNKEKLQKNIDVNMCVCVRLGHSLILSLVLLDTGGGEFRAGQGQPHQQHHRVAHYQAAHHTSGSSSLNSIHKVSQLSHF